MSTKPQLRHSPRKSYTLLNCLVLWNTVYIDDALRQLRAQGYPVLDEGGSPRSVDTGCHAASSTLSVVCCS
jgi:hypothetical protein